MHLFFFFSRVHHLSISLFSEPRDAVRRHFGEQPVFALDALSRRHPCSFRQTKLAPKSTCYYPRQALLRRLGTLAKTKHRRSRETQRREPPRRSGLMARGRAGAPRRSTDAPMHLRPPPSPSVPSLSRRSLLLRSVSRRCVYAVLARASRCVLPYVCLSLSFSRNFAIAITLVPRRRQRRRRDNGGNLFLSRPPIPRPGSNLTSSLLSRRWFLFLVPLDRPTRRQTVMTIGGR